MTSNQTIAIKAQFRDDFRRFSINIPSTFSNLLQSIKTVYNLEETSLRIFHLDKTRGPSSVNDDEDMKQMFSNNHGNTIRLLLIDNNSGSNSALDQMCDRILNSTRFQNGLANLMENILTSPNFQSKLLAAGIKPLVQQEFNAIQQQSQQQQSSPLQESPKQEKKQEIVEKQESEKKEEVEQQPQPQQIHSEPIAIPQKEEISQQLQNEQKQEQPQPQIKPSSPPKKGFLDSFVDSFRSNKKKQQKQQQQQPQPQPQPQQPQPQVQSIHEEQIQQAQQPQNVEKNERELEEEISIIENLGFGLQRSEIAEILKFHFAYGEGIESAIESCLARQREQAEQNNNLNNNNHNSHPITV